MSDSIKRQEVYRAYSGPDWQNRVNKMSDSQIVAVYMRLKAKGKIK